MLLVFVDIRREVSIGLMSCVCVSETDLPNYIEL